MTSDLVRAQLFFDEAPLSWCYTAATLISALSLFARLIGAGDLADHPLLVFLPGILVCSSLIGRGTGLYVTVIGGVFSLQDFQNVDPIHFNGALIDLLLYGVVGFGAAGVIDALRTVSLKLARAEEDKAVLLSEMTHRVKNNTQLIVGLLDRELRCAAGKTVMIERQHYLDLLATTIERIRIVDRINNRFMAYGRRAPSVSVDIGGFIAELCDDMQATAIASRPIEITKKLVNMSVDAKVALYLGLILNELVTNAVKHAFPPERPVGEIEVSLAFDRGFFELVVIDDGIGYPDAFVAGMGTELLWTLAKQRPGGDIDFRTTRGGGTMVAVRVPREAR